jgi:TonB family protein
MPQNPMLQPDSYDSSSSWDERSHQKSDEKSGAGKSAAHLGDVVSAGDPRDVAEVARALAAHGGGEASFELALDLILHEVVEQARLATGATGAAIALARAGEMVCRATSGPDAPDLGVRLETASGLSGACLQTGTVQLCGDTEADPRVDAAACRRLGVRSILVLPLGDGPQPFGILEVFSSLLDAFGDHDVSSLKNLARRVVAPNVTASFASTTGTERFAPVQACVDDMPVAPEIAQTIESTAVHEPEAVAELAAAPAADGGFKRGTDLWAAFLVVLVIMTAIVLGLALGWRGATVRGVNGGPAGGSSQAPASASSADKTADKSADKTDGAADSQAEQEAPGDSATPTKSGSSSEQGSVKAATSVEPPSGGLVVTQNGKVIYRLSPGQSAAEAGNKARGNGVPRPESDAAASRLIHRVEPVYPEGARTQHIQGLVTLDVQIGGEGAVHNIAVVDGNATLAEAAVQAVRQWRYQTYSVDGRPAEMQTRVTIRFTLPSN